jgi:hypothetical protein
VDFHGPGIDMGFERIEGVWQIGHGECHGWLPPVMVVGPRRWYPFGGVGVELTDRLPDTIIRPHAYPPGRGPAFMTDSEWTKDDAGGGFGCWGMAVIGVLILAVLVVGYLVLV